MNATHRLVLLLAALVLAGCAGKAQPASAPTGTRAAPPTAQPPTPQPASAAPAPANPPTAAAAEPQPTLAAAPTAIPTEERVPAAPVLQEYPVPRGSHPHDVAPAPDGAIWYTAQ